MILALALSALAADLPVNDDGTVRFEGADIAIAAPWRKFVEPYLQARGADLASLSADGTQMIVTTRFADTPQMHLVTTPGGARTQLTFGTEPSRGGFIHGSTDLLITRDIGGNENFQLFRRPVAGGSATLLTDGESRTTTAVFSEDGQRLLFDSNARNGRDMDLWLSDGKTASSARLLVQVDGDYTPGPFCSDNVRALVMHETSALHGEWFVVNTDSAAMTRLTAEDPEAHYIDAAWSADCATVYTLSDKGADLHRLVALDVATGAERLVWADPQWNVDAFALSPDGKTLAFTTNEGGWSKLRLVDVRKGKVREVALPEAGLVGGLQYARDANVLAATLSGPRSLGDAFTLDPKTLAWTRWTTSEMGGLDVASLAVPETITVTSFDGTKVPALIYRPKGTGPFPVVIGIHGGPEGQSKPAWSALSQVLVANGIAVIQPNVRGSTGYGRAYLRMDDAEKRLDSVSDIGAILDWIATQPDLDAERVAVNGGSYGGFMVLASLVAYSDRLVAGIDIVGIANFVTFLENTSAYRRDLRRVEYGDERVPAMRALFDEKISPAPRADRIKSSLFVIHGANDPRVPVSEAEQIVAAVRSNGNPAWYLLARNEGHGFRKLQNTTLQMSLQLAFFADRFGLQPPH